MSEPTNLINPISFGWMPRPYLVKWADSCEEVPEWDVTRGCPLWAHFDEARQKQTWGPKYTPPTWEVKPAPETGYPRLVRAGFNDYIGGGERRQDYPLLNDLSMLNRYIDAWRAGKNVKRLKNKVAKLSSTYGEASGMGNTLTEWLRLAAEVRLHKRLKRALKEGGLEGLETEWLMAYTALADRKVVDKEETIRRQRLAREMKPVNGVFSFAAPTILSDLDPIEERVFRELESIRGWLGNVKLSEAKTTKTVSREVRLKIANTLYDHFGVALFHEPKMVMLQHWGVRAHCRVDVWLQYALSEMWRHDLEVKMCPICHTLFTPTQGNNIYCKPGGACAVKANNRKKKTQTE